MWDMTNWYVTKRNGYRCDCRRCTRSYCVLICDLVRVRPVAHDGRFCWWAWLDYAFIAYWQDSYLLVMTLTLLIRDAASNWCSTITWRMPYGHDSCFIDMTHALLIRDAASNWSSTITWCMPYWHDSCLIDVTLTFLFRDAASNWCFIITWRMPYRHDSSLIDLTHSLLTWFVRY